MNKNAYVNIWWVETDINKQLTKIKKCYSNRNFKKLESNVKYRRILSNVCFEHP